MKPCQLVVNDISKELSIIKLVRKFSDGSQIEDINPKIDSSTILSWSYPKIRHIIFMDYLEISGKILDLYGGGVLGITIYLSIHDCNNVTFSPKFKPL